MMNVIGEMYYQDSVVVVMKGFEIEYSRILMVFSIIDLSSNNFQGDIPKSIAKLNSLRGLNLSHNNLTSHIPTSLANLTNLESLDLSSNKLVGEIPCGNLALYENPDKSSGFSWQVVVMGGWEEGGGLGKEKQGIEAAEIKDEAVEKDDVQEVDTDVTVETNTVVKSTWTPRKDNMVVHINTLDRGRGLNSIPWKMGVMLRWVLPICGIVCFFYPSLRARSRQSVKRYKNLLADIFPRFQRLMSSFRKVVIAAGAPLACCRKAVNAKKKQASMQLEQVNIDSYKDRFNTLLLVSTLIATVTFAAGCTIPGGYNNIEPDQGMPTMLKHKWFHIFIFCDTIAPLLLLK
ncbi:unnamed protein product [Camellia sinensis]